MKCMICDKELKNANGLAKHLHNQHNISKEDYYKKYINETSGKCLTCGKDTTFRNIGQGYLKYCSLKCRPTTSYWTGKKQPKEMIDKRRDTLVERYGVANGFLTSNCKTEIYKGFVTRSKYERIFLDYCEDRRLTVSVPDRIKYVFEDRERWFYPDFFIEEYDLITEIKSNYTYHLHLEMNIQKQVSTLAQGYDIMFIDEEHGLVDDWNLLDHYLNYYRSEYN